MKKMSGGNYREFARQLGVDVAQLHRVMNTDSNAGPKFLGKFMIYCNHHQINFNDYIFLDKPLHANNKKPKTPA